MPNQSGTWVDVNDQELSQSCNQDCWNVVGKCILIRSVKLSKEGLPELSKEEISRMTRERDVVEFDLAQQEEKCDLQGEGSVSCANPVSF